MSKKRRKRKRDVIEVEENDQDADFYFIAGFTSGGSPYGITWDEAQADGLIDQDEQVDNIGDNDLPF